MKANRLFMPGLLVLLASAGPATAQTPDPAAPGRRNVSYPAADSTPLSGYLALPPGSGPFPGVVMIHEWWGLNEDTALLADALAREGFAVLAADAFRGKVAREPAEAAKLSSGTPADRIASDLDAARAYLSRHPAVKADRIASLGFCFGGTQSMRMGARNPGLAAVVIFYGGGPFQSAAELGAMDKAGPVLGIYGAKDAGIPVEKVRAFQSALEERRIRNVISVYPDVGHAFVKSGTYNQGGSPEKAWRQAVDFLKDNLR